MDDTELGTLVGEIGRAQLRYEKLVFDERRSHTLGAPASRETILSFESRLGARLPADYRAFLQRHDGWQNFHADGKLLATRDQEAGWVRKKIQFWSEQWDSEDPDPFVRGALPILLGESLHHFVVLDPTRLGSDGAAAIIEYDGMQERLTYASFSALLRDELDVLRGLIARELHGLPEDDAKDASASDPK